MTHATPALTPPQQAALDAATRYLRQMLTAPQDLRGQQTRGTGPVAEFESLLSRRTGFPYALATCNATLSLLITALVLKVEGKEVIIPPNAWPGTHGPFAFAGARLVTASADAHGNLLVEALPDFITQHTCAVIAVDWQCHRHDRQALRQLCDAHDLLYIEDSSFLPSWDSLNQDKSLADVQTPSFGPGKSLPLGEGGAVLTRHRWIYEAAVAMSQHPERVAAEGIEVENAAMSLNARMHPLAALVGREMLR